jgi:large subunit ribosomal protein L32e
MADEPTTPTAEETPKEADAPAAPTPSRSLARRRRTKTPAPLATKEQQPVVEEAKAPRVPRRATLDPKTARALSVRRSIDRRRPLFVRQAAHRYYRIGRDESWRRPRGLQSKQRRHYGYRSEVVSVGYRSPARARGLVPSGFRPVLVETTKAIERLDPLKDAAILARGIGTRRRLVLEEAARRLGVRVLNPIATPETEE